MQFGTLVFFSPQRRLLRKETIRALPIGVEPMTFQSFESSLNSFWLDIKQKNKIVRAKRLLARLQPNLFSIIVSQFAVTQRPNEFRTFSVTSNRAHAVSEKMSFVCLQCLFDQFAKLGNEPVSEKKRPSSAKNQIRRFVRVYVFKIKIFTFIDHYCIEFWKPFSIKNALNHTLKILIKLQYYFNSLLPVNVLKRIITGS